LKRDAFTSKQACYLSGCTSHQLRYWDKVKLVSPTIQSSNGKPGVPKLYSFRDIVSLRVIKTLLDNGMSIQRVRRAWRYLTKNGNLEDQLSNIRLVSDGKTIYTLEDEIVFDALKSGQLAFFETIDNVTKEVREDVSKFELDKERFLNLLTKVEEDVLSQKMQA
tara:strand:+ start:392 stop:883 length:492 start_codon:yes stop_codon:yes gene_type:complete